jgi:hypothetical protein
LPSALHILSGIRPIRHEKTRALNQSVNVRVNRFEQRRQVAVIPAARVLEQAAFNGELIQRHENSVARVLNEPFAA